MAESDCSETSMLLSLLDTGMTWSYSVSLIS